MRSRRKLELLAVLLLLAGSATSQVLGPSYPGTQPGAVPMPDFHGPLLRVPHRVSRGVIHIAPPASSRFQAAWYPPTGDPLQRTRQPIRSAPYTATRTTDQPILRDGASQTEHLLRKRLQRRDAAGRMRTEAVNFELKVDGGGDHIETRDVWVNDPVSHCTFEWTEPWNSRQEPTATVQCLPRIVEERAGSVWDRAMRLDGHHVAATGETLEQTSTLEDRVQDGLTEKGVRWTRTLKDAHTRATTTEVHEIWFAPELEEVVEMRPVPERVGVAAYALTNIVRGEPDAALFYPPAGYRIVPK